jgi:hypothetical protein
MSRFLTEPILVCLLPERIASLGLDPGQAWFEVHEDLVYESDKYGRITVPKGYITNLASIPRLARPYLNPDDTRIAAPSMVHDSGYSDHRDLTRKQWDEILEEGMIVNGARKTMAALVFRLVQWFGASHWK